MERVQVHFLVDLMLMHLGRWLRLMGQDAANPEGISDDALLIQARRENRTIITRDKRLFQACRGAGVQCLLIRSCKISGQLLEMAREGVPLQLDPERCTLCNTLLQEVECEQSMKWECPGCKKLYWREGTGERWKGCWRLFAPEEMKILDWIPKETYKVTFMEAASVLLGLARIFR